MFADRRRLLAAGAIVLALVVAAAAWVQTRPAPAAGTATPVRARTPRGEAAPAGPVPALKLEALAAGRTEPSGTNRNPFRFQPKVVAPPPRTVAPPAAVTRPATPPVPAGPPPPPPIPLKFIALVERANGVKWAVLSDGKVTMYGKDGDNIDGRYRIVKIGAESIELTYLDGRGRQVIRLTGQ
ncbi:MAG: hypothetical protein AB7P34_09580 [Vicinamibacterales bacterium]